MWITGTKGLTKNRWRISAKVKSLSECIWNSKPSNFPFGLLLQNGPSIQPPVWYVFGLTVPLSIHLCTCLSISLSPCEYPFSLSMSKRSLVYVHVRTSRTPLSCLGGFPSSPKCREASMVYVVMYGWMHLYTCIRIYVCLSDVLNPLSCLPRLVQTCRHRVYLDTEKTGKPRPPEGGQPRVSCEFCLLLHARQELRIHSRLLYLSKELLFVFTSFSPSCLSWALVHISPCASCISLSFLSSMLSSSSRFFTWSSCLCSPPPPALPFSVYWKPVALIILFFSSSSSIVLIRLYGVCDGLGAYNDALGICIWRSPWLRVCYSSRPLADEEKAICRDKAKGNRKEMIERKRKRGRDEDTGAVAGRKKRRRRRWGWSRTGRQGRSSKERKSRRRRGLAARIFGWSCDVRGNVDLDIYIYI